MDLNQKEKIKEIITEMDSIKLKLDSLGNSLHRILEVEGIIDISVYNIRRAAILEEVYRANSIVSAEELSSISTKWGRNPQGAAGYFSGTYPSLRGIANGKRALTDRGLQIVMENRKQYGEDWLDKVDIKYVGNPNTPEDAIISI